MIHRLELNRIRTVLTENKIDLENELQTLHVGQLYCLEKDGKWYYYELFPKTGNRKKEKRVGITKDTDRVFALVRKTYVTKALMLIEKDIKVLDMAIKHYIDYDEEAVMSKLLDKHPELREGIYHGQQKDEIWADAYERQSDFYEEDKKSISAKGVLMRSKNEVYIASRLDHFNIPYRYEASVAHPDVSRIPDFTIRRPRDRKIIYWEHLGKTKDESYMSGNEIKFIEFSNSGIVPWDNLIVTYDTPDGGIDAKIIDAMIQGWLL